MTLVAALDAAVKRNTGHALRLFAEGREVDRIGHDQLYAEAGQLACGLAERGVVPGERVAIALPTSVDFARAFFGVVAAGAVAVPLPPPLRFGSLDAHARRIIAALRQSQVKVILTNKALGGLLEPFLAGAAGRFSILDVARTAAPGALYAQVGRQDPALVQYTSGTVESPKGVVLSHANLLANVAAIARAVGVADGDVGCNWLPMFHDMGLIGAFITPVLNGVETQLLRPEDFVRDPGRWLRVISRHGGTITVAPSTAYLHTLRRTSGQLVRELDLSRWRLAINGAEAVDPHVIREFSRHFGPAGFRQTAFLPVYGLAEGSLAVTCSPLGRPVRSRWVRRDLLSHRTVAFTRSGAALAREVVSVGMPVAGTEIRLVADNGAVLSGEPAVGEIQIRGASVMRGYEAAGKGTPGCLPGDRWVPTGDLGFRHDGELYVTGRKKEMVILFGQNYYAGDIESAAGRVPGVDAGGVLAAPVSFPDGEGLVLVVETRERERQARADLVTQVTQAVSSTLGITPRDVILVRRGKLPRTSSGKLLRHGGDALYEELGAQQESPIQASVDQSER
ncbi:MAG: AMP-binding protein [Gaiellaceae bacterium]